MRLFPNVGSRTLVEPLISITLLEITLLNIPTYIFVVFFRYISRIVPSFPFLSQAWLVSYKLSFHHLFPSTFYNAVDG